MENREKFSSRIGFLLISAGCAIGLGNVWRFPFITGQYGGAAFVLIYLFFLIILGLPILVMEYAVGRASQKSIARSFQVLEPKGTKWHWYSYVGMAGNYLLMMFYTTVAGWMISYFFKMLKGDFVGKNPAQIENTFWNDAVGSKGTDLLDVSSHCIGIFSMFSWSSKWSREDHNSYDVMFVYCNSSIDRKECNFRWSLCRIKILFDPRFCSSEETRCDDGRIRSNGTGVFYTKSWNRGDRNLWKLH